jgi:hypothetical protein
MNWKCPYCGHHQIVGNNRVGVGTSMPSAAATGDLMLVGTGTVCLNPDCRQLTLAVALKNRRVNTSRGINEPYGDPIASWDLLPESRAQPQPDYILEALRQDYAEACLIAHTSPKASATLARRCLQGMIRDFAKISRPRLIEEIRALRAAVEDGKAPRGVTPESVEAIDQVRGIGNIAAHMEADVNVIVDVDPGEADAMIDLIEQLFAEWYVAQHERTAMLERVAAIAADKKRALAAPKAEAVPVQKATGLPS